MTILLLALGLIAMAFVLFKASTEFVHSVRLLGQRSRVHTFFFMSIGILAATVIPELMVTIAATSFGAPVFGLGTAMGANAALMGLVVPLAVLTSGLIIRVNRSAFTRMAILLMLASVLFPFFLLENGMIGILSGVLLLVLFVVYALYIFGKRYVGEYGVTHPLHHAKALSHHHERQYMWFTFIFSLIVLLVTGVFFTGTALMISGLLFISPYLTAFFIAGPALVLPAFIMAIVAAREKEMVLLFSDVFGALVANALLIPGLIGVLTTVSIKANVVLYNWSFITLSVIAGLFGLFSFTKGKLVKWEAGALLAIYALFFFIMSML